MATIGTSLTTIATFSAGYPRIGIAISSAAGSATLNAFQVQVQVVADGDWFVLKSSDFTTGTFPCWANADLTTLAAEASALLTVEGGYWYQIRLQASVASSTATVTAVAHGG